MSRSCLAPTLAARAKEADAAARAAGEPGTVYMLHLSVPYRHARHHVGWTDNLPARLRAHAAGRGARLIAVVLQAGIGFDLARTVPGSRATERAIKRAGGAVRYCPVCTPRPLNGKWARGGKTPSRRAAAA